MAAWMAEVVTPWVAAEDDPGAFPAHHPQLADDYPLLAWTDTTGQPAANLVPEPNLLVLSVLVAEETLAAIEADANYYVLWSEEQA